MSEYQYYEFQAIDRSLSQDEMNELRALTTRATITPTRLQNVYHWGDFQGDPRRLMERNFDAFVYVANWGTRRLMLRLPRAVLDPAAVVPYCVGGFLDLHVTEDHVILEFQTDQEGGGWIEDEEAAGWMPALIPVRADLASGDLRALYIGWLTAVQAGTFDEAEGEREGWNGTGEWLEHDEIEPPVPPGLGHLSVALEELAGFLGVDQDLIVVAAGRSAELHEPSQSSRDVERWIVSLPEAEKNELLVQLLRGDRPHLRGELLVRYRRAHAPAQVVTPGLRTAADLFAAAERQTEERERAEAEREARERERRQREEAAARAAYLGGLVGSEEELWRRAETLIEIKRAGEYDEAVHLLTDLRDLSVRSQSYATFRERLDALRLRHARKTTFIERMDRAELVQS